jgi:hypothetical protein
VSKVRDNSRSKSKNASLSGPKKLWKPTTYNNAPIPGADEPLIGKAQISNIRESHV